MLDRRRVERDLLRSGRARAGRRELVVARCEGEHRVGALRLDVLVDLGDDGRGVAAGVVLVRRSRVADHGEHEPRDRPASGSDGAADRARVGRAGLGRAAAGARGDGAVAGARARGATAGGRAGGTAAGATAVAEPVPLPASPPVVNGGTKTGLPELSEEPHPVDVSQKGSTMTAPVATVNETANPVTRTQRISLAPDPQVVGATHRRASLRGTEGQSLR